ncbi:hypothetical protein VTK73DRAFT_5583 [Phialemonium thermophilum]|uniref:WW domain-containing protein n=1 Tax=Phialemonium thermophilum TaxID=223376 RepID=A0ABR3WMT1_9PEZI
MNSPPPTYEEAVRSGSRRATPEPGRRPGTASSADTDDDMDQIPSLARRSMEDETRPLPPGWVRSFDPETCHQFFVDTTQDPPRAIWHHPFDDEAYVNSLSREERDRLVGQSLLLPPNNKRDAAPARQTDPQARVSAGAGPAAAPHPPGPDDSAGSLERLGRKFKDRLTSTTHAERAADRRRRANAEAEAHRQHLALRGGLANAMRTGQPQVIGRDEEGRPVLIEPPGLGRDQGLVERRRLNPWMTEVRYVPGAAPFALGEGRLVRVDGLYPGSFYNGAMGMGYGRPRGPYERPMGGRYGGGLGFPLGMPLLGGVMLGQMGGMML